MQVNIEAIRVPFDALDGCGLGAEKHRQVALDRSGAWNDDVAHQKIKSVAPSSAMCSTPRSGPMTSTAAACVSRSTSLSDASISSASLRGNRLWPGARSSSAAAGHTSQS